MGYLTIKNWSEFQHYKDRNPPWIKLHRTLLDDYEFACLQDASKLHLILIWLFGSQSEGRVPDDPDFLQRKLGLKSKPDLKSLIDHGFLIAGQDASNALAPDASKLRLETYKTTEKKKKVSLPPDFSISERVSTWAASEGFDQLPKRFEHFIGYVKAHAKTYADWDAAFMNAIRDDWAKLGKETKKLGGLSL